MRKVPSMIECAVLWMRKKICPERRIKSWCWWGPSMALEEAAEPWSSIGAFLNTTPLDTLEQADTPEALKNAKFLKKVGFKAPLSLKAVQELTTIAGQGDHDAGLSAETNGLHAIFSSEDALEGLSSVLERRRPSFKGL